MRAMILAAGRGERMRPLTDHLPKPLLSVGGKALIEHHLAALAQAGFDDVVINHAWLGDKIEAALGDGHRYGVCIRYSPEQAGALETAGGIRQALPLLGNQPFVVINGDVLTDFPLDRLHRALPDNKLAHLILVSNPPQHAEGDFSLHAGLVGNDNSNKLTFSGIAVYRPEFFQSIGSGPQKLAPYLRAAISRQLISGEHYQGYWADIGTPERLAAANLALSHRS